MAMVLKDKLPWSISLWDMSFVVVSVWERRRRRARLSRMVPGFVSGISANMTRKVGPASQSISHRAHRQFSAVTEKPEIMGPIAGPAQAARAQKLMRYGRVPMP